MQVQKIQNDTNCNPHFNGKFSMYNYHKNRFFVKTTTPEEDKILSDLFNSIPLKLKMRNSCSTYSEMEYADLLEYINLFSKKSKGLNLPKPSEPCYTDAGYFTWKNNSRYNVVANKTFKIEHVFNKWER